MNKTTKTSKSSKAKPSKSLKEAPRQRPNDSSTRPNDSALEPKDQTSAERTIALAERTKDFEGDVPALMADSIPSTISSDATLARPNEPIVRSDRPPNSAVLARKSIDAMERMYLEGGWSLSEIGNFFHLSKSTVHGYLVHLISDPEARAKHEARRQQFHPASNPDGGQLDANATQPGPNGEQSYPNAAQSPRSDTSPSQPTNEDGSNGSYSPQIPRINSEVVSIRPRVIEQPRAH